MTAFIYDGLAGDSFAGCQSNLNNGVFNIYQGQQPPVGIGITNQILLVQLLWGSPSFNPPTESGGIAKSVASVITSGVVIRSGVAGFFGWISSFDILLITGSVGAIGSGADLELNTVNLTKGAIVVANSISIILPET